MVKPELLAVAILLAVCNKALIDYLFAPIRKKYPDLDLWFVLYVAFVTGGVIGFLANVNLFEGVAPGLEGIYGRILTACVVGGGSSLIHDVFDKKDTLVENG